MTFIGICWQVVVTGVLLLVGIGLLDLWLSGRGCGDCGNTGYNVDTDTACGTCGGDGQLDDNEAEDKAVQSWP